MKFFLIETKSLKGKKKKKNSKTSNKNIKNNFKLKLVEIINFFFEFTKVICSFSYYINLNNLYFLNPFSDIIYVCGTNIVLVYICSM